MTFTYYNYILLITTYSYIYDTFIFYDIYLYFDIIFNINKY